MDSQTVISHNLLREDFRHSLPFAVIRHIKWPTFDDSTYRRLHAAQLIKHILGLVRGSDGKGRVRLLYLWYDALGKPGAEHRDEIERFAEIAVQDGINLHSMTYQELILRLADRCRSVHTDYVAYLSSRYL